MEESHCKLWEIIDTCKTAALVTKGADSFAHVRTMECLETKIVEEIWFTTSINERKIKEIKHDSKVTVFYSADDQSWVCVYGRAEIVNDQELKNRFWSDDWETYFSEGPDSEEYSLIRIVPQAADYLYREGYERGHITFETLSDVNEVVI